MFWFGSVASVSHKCSRSNPSNGLIVGSVNTLLLIGSGSLSEVVFKGPVLWTANNSNWTGLGLEKTGTAVPVFQFLRTKDHGPRPVRTGLKPQICSPKKTLQNKPKNV